jgi:hypothetical protein
MNDPFELSGRQRPPLTVWMIARGVFWGLMMWTLFAFLAGFAFGLFRVSL